MAVGRPKLYFTDEEREAARKASTDKSRLKTKNVTLDADLITGLNALADKLNQKFGFRPTLSQTVRHLLKQEIQQCD